MNRNVIVKSFLATGVIASAFVGPSAKCEPAHRLPSAIFKAVSLGRFSGPTYPVHVAVIDATANPIRIDFPNLRCSGVLQPIGPPRPERFRRYSKLYDYRGLVEHDLILTTGHCSIAGSVVLQHMPGKNCDYCGQMTYFYFGRDGHASGAELRLHLSRNAMTADEAEEEIDRERLR